MSTPRQSPPSPQPGPDPREAKITEPIPDAPDRAQSPDRATMNPLPPANDEDSRVSMEGGQLREQGVEHRDFPAAQRPVPSDLAFPPVADDRVTRPRPGPPLPDDE